MELGFQALLKFPYTGDFSYSGNLLVACSKSMARGHVIAFVVIESLKWNV